MNKERKLKLSILYDPEELDSSYESDSSLEVLPEVDSPVSVLREVRFKRQVRWPFF